MSFEVTRAIKTTQVFDIQWSEIKPKAQKRRPCQIVPPHIVKKMRQKEECPKYHSRHAKELRNCRKEMIAAPLATANTAKKATKKSIMIFDVRNGNDLVGSKPKCPKRDGSVKRAKSFAGNTYDFYLSQLNRNSLDDNGMAIQNSVHYGVDYNNAFWDSQNKVMVYGDGDGKIFTSFTNELKVIAHELTHAVTEYSSGLLYEGQSGALNESMSDVMAICADLFTSKKSSLSTYGWTIGEGVMTGKYALRSLKKPGTAYIDHPSLGTDPQPSHMSNYQDLPNTQKGDFGGVHINSGIPNHAFYLFCTSLYSQSKTQPYETPAKIWYQTQFRIKPSCDFETFARTTLKVCRETEKVSRRGVKGPIETALLTAWQAVGIDP